MSKLLKIWSVNVIRSDLFIKLSTIFLQLHVQHIHCGLVLLLLVESSSKWRNIPAPSGSFRKVNYKLVHSHDHN